MSSLHQNQIDLSNVGALGLGKLAGDLQDWRLRVRRRIKQTGHNPGDTHVAAVIDWLERVVEVEAELRDRAARDGGR